MLDTRKHIVAILKKILKNTQYEMDVQTPSLPLITYKVINDSVHSYGDTVGYSDVTYLIKIWTNNVKDLSTYSEQIDNKLKDIGLKRTYYTELKEGEVLIGVFQYSGLVKEQFMED